jgi:hypothetical protein
MFIARKTRLLSFFFFNFEAGGPHSYHNYLQKSWVFWPQIKASKEKKEWFIKSFPVLFVCLNNCAVLQQQLFLSECCVSECLATCPSRGRASSTGTINLRSSSDGIGYAKGHGVCWVRHGADVTWRGQRGHNRAGQCNSVPKDRVTATSVFLTVVCGFFPFFYLISHINLHSLLQYLYLFHFLVSIFLQGLHALFFLFHFFKSFLFPYLLLLSCFFYSSPSLFIPSSFPLHHSLFFPDVFKEIFLILLNR